MPGSHAVHAAAYAAITVEKRMRGPIYLRATPPPPGVTSDLDNPADAGRAVLLAFIIVCNFFVLVFFSIRAYVSLAIQHRILFEDGVDSHIRSYRGWSDPREVSTYDYSQILKWLYAGTVVYCPAAYFTKITLLLVIARVFAVRSRVSMGIHIFIVALFIAYIPIQVLKTIVCLPIRAYWDDSVHGRCLDQYKLFISDIALAILTDFIILVLPIPLTWSLRASTKDKLKVTAILSAGGVAVGVTCYRMYLTVVNTDTANHVEDFVRVIISVAHDWSRVLVPTISECAGATIPLEVVITTCFVQSADIQLEFSVPEAQSSLGESIREVVQTRRLGNVYCL
ncbi:uncharacterized protein DNG_08920 [Cephalotrichum gorgonifer]|uniref:Rhodopsin domain-containing protein n=1 Tax=Cephalotrichum gorgonifer TaxID=2041049 RepID=A0AAE8N4K1_9PEZI|nr:uncharacterized protein DNG_08920 [Cephalotrichum gorgonifer]